MKAIIYYRKSTDTDDKQQNSLEHQLNNCKKTAELNNLKIYKEIGESKSAKTEFKREGFNEMIKDCKLGRVDYIICDEPKRLSRNNLDTSRIIDLLDKKQIKGILCTSREYHGENSRDKFLLQLDLSLSKMDNEDRAKDIKDKMMTAFKKGNWVAKAPVGYKNITIKKGHKTIEVDIDKAPYIKRAFELRTFGYSLERISDYLFENNIYSEKTKKGYRVEQIKRILTNKFYMGIMVWGGEEIKGKHKPIISKDLFYKVNNEVPKESIIHTIRNKNGKFNFTGLIKSEEENITLAGYQKKGRVYYRNGFNSKVLCNISEKIVFERLKELFKPFDKTPRIMEEITIDMLQEIYDKAKGQKEVDIKKAKNKILKLKERKDILLNTFLDGDIDKDTYKSKTKELEKDIISLEKISVSKSKISRKIQRTLKVHSELILGLYKRFSGLKDDEKMNIVKSLKMSFIANSKKELYIAENSPYKALQNLLFHVWYSQGESNSCLDRERVPS